MTKIIMQAAIAIHCLGLLIWGGAANAESDLKTYTVIVSQHVETKKLSKEAVEAILSGSSKILRSTVLNRYDKNDGPCEVKFTLAEGRIPTFKESEAPAVIRTESEQGETDKEKVFKVGRKDLGGPPLQDGGYLKEADLYVKVVKKINFCIGPIKKPGCDEIINERGCFYGCAYPQYYPRTKNGKLNRSIIVAEHTFGRKQFPSLLWAHEFGHVAGLPHRDKEATELLKYNLMNADSITVWESMRLGKNIGSVVVHKDKECDCLKRIGPDECRLSY